VRNLLIRAKHLLIAAIVVGWRGFQAVRPAWWSERESAPSALDARACQRHRLPLNAVTSAHLADEACGLVRLPRDVRARTCETCDKPDTDRICREGEDDRNRWRNIPHCDSRGRACGNDDSRSKVDELGGQFRQSFGASGPERYSTAMVWPCT
jgi:hypothetical protein